MSEQFVAPDENQPSGNVVSAEIPVSGVRTNDDVTKCLQALYDVFAADGLGGATFEVTDTGTTLIIKHRDTVEPNIASIDAALRSAGEYAVLRQA